MKRVVCLVMCICVMATVVLTGCSSGVKQEDYDAVKTELESAEAQYALLKDDYDTLKKEYDEYKERMSEYETLEKAEAEARLIEAERIKKEAEEAENAEKARAEAEAEAKAKQGYETGITYDQLARTPDTYEGEKVKFKGKVIQVMEGDEYTQIRLAVNSNYNTILYAEYEKDLVSSRVLEDDVITIYGTSAGLLSYESTGAGTITIPAVLVEKIDQ